MMLVYVALMSTCANIVTKIQLTMSAAQADRRGQAHYGCVFGLTPSISSLGKNTQKNWNRTEAGR